MQTVSICVLTAKSKAKETQTKSKVGKETLLIGHEHPDFLLISRALVTGTGKSATAVSPNRMPRLPPPPENGFAKLLTLLTLTRSLCTADQVSRAWVTCSGPPSQSCWRNKLPPLLGVLKWEMLQTQESCAEGASQAKTCKCLSHHPEDLFLRPKIQPSLIP